MRRFFLTVLTICLCLAALPARAEENGAAREITRDAQVTLFSFKRGADAAALMDGDYRTECEARKKGAYVEITLPDDSPCHTLYALSVGDPETLVVEEEAGGNWRTVPVEGQRFNIQCIPMDGSTHFRLSSTGDYLRLMEVRLFGAGELPPEIVNYHAVADKADLLVLACHPDDDILWMGGLMPTYAGQLGMKVQVAYMAADLSYRRCEAMDGLWHCGVRTGPIFAGLPDSGDVPYKKAVAMWGGSRATALRIARLIRETRPEVLVTQDRKGEYGHVQHRAMVSACTQAVRIAADPKEKKLKDLPVWEVKKYYIHLYPEDALVLDFECPLPAFGGKSAFEVAKEAFALHTSQQSGRHEVEIDGPYDIRRYGLAYSAVGPDEAHDGLFEHIDGLYEIERSLSRNTDGEM